MSTHQKTIIDSIQKNGYAKLENFFSDSDLQLISKKLQNVSSIYHQFIIFLHIHANLVNSLFQSYQL